MSAIEQTDLALILPLSGVQAIEASAGTGKTYALAGIHARLIVEKKLQVREILVVTYTRAAADELRGRLRERLTLCAQIAEGAEPAPDIAEKSEAKFCRQLIANAHAAGEARNALVRRLRLAALSLDQAQISTVHAFCERALRELAWSGGVPPLDGKLVDALVLIDTIAADLWRERATATDTLAWNALLAVAKSPSGFASLLRELRDTDSVLEPETILSADVLRERIVQAQTVWPDLRKIWRVQGAEAFVALTQQVAADHISKTSYPLEKVAKDAQEFARAFSADMRPDRKLLSRYTTAAIEKARRKKGQSLPTQRFFAAVAAAETTLEQAEIALHQLGLLVLHDCALEMRWRQQRQQREARGYTYDDLISRLHETLCGVHGATTAQILAQRFPVALVDECQDSDARQFDIFLAIYAQRGLLCLIGDPKQSIYRFRGGDVHAYLRALDRADAKHALDRNFRSTPALIAAVNRLYRDAGDAAFGDAQIEFKPVHAGGKACDDDLLIESVAPTPLRIWQMANACSNKAQAMQLLAAGCAEEIVRLLALARGGKALLRREQQDGTRKHEPLRAEDLAVLVARHTEATAMQRALAARGVSSVVVSRASVFASDEASELLGLLRALDSFDPERLRGALSTRLLGKTLADMAALASDVQAWHDQATRFAAWRERWYEHGVLALIELVAEDAAARLLAHADGERRLTNLLHLAELLQQAEPERDGTRALLDWLQQRIARADKDREEEQLRLESDAGRVHIVTVHQSKGLEYPLVFLPFSALRRDERRGEVEVCARFEGVRRVVHLCNTDGADDAPARTRERSEARSEDLRLLYVALTRARVACYFAWGEIGKGSEPPALAALLSAGADSISSGSVSARLAELAASAPNLIACLPLPEPTSQRLAPQDAAALADARQAHRRVHEWRRSHSFSGLSAGAREAQRSGPDIAGGEDERNIGATAIDTPAVPTVLRGTRFGTTFHELLEKVDFSTWRGWQESSPPPTQRDLVDRILHRYAFDSGDDKSAARAVFVQLIVATLNAPLPLGARLADLAPTEHRAEMPFHFAMRSGDAQPWLARMQADGYVQARRHFALEGNRLAGLMTGVLDLVVFHDARWWVIDYKTNLLGTNAAEDYAPARLAIAVREGEYDLQYLIYLTALHRWLKTRLGAAYDYERDIGGALYLFVRGLDSGGVDGVHLDKPPSALIEALDEMLKAPVEIAA